MGKVKPLKLIEGQKFNVELESVNLQSGTALFNLETAVGTQKSAQALGAPGKIKKCPITTEVTTIFLFHHAHQNLTRLFCAQLPFLGLTLP